MGKTFSLSDTDLAYIAGFLDGDGSIIGSIEPHHEKKFGYRVRTIVKFSQFSGNVSILEYLKEKIGVGYVSYGAESSEFVIKSQSDVKTLLSEIIPFVVLKKRQIELALKLLSIEVISREDLFKVADLATQISSLNLRRKSRRKHTLTTLMKNVSRND